jgi:hypothetical protein
MFEHNGNKHINKIYSSITEGMLEYLQYSKKYVSTGV